MYIERSKTDQTGEGAYVVVTPDTLVALELLRQDTDSWADVLTIWLKLQDLVRDTPVTPGVWAWPSG